MYGCSIACRGRRIWNHEGSCTIPEDNPAQKSGLKTKPKETRGPDIGPLPDFFSSIWSCCVTGALCFLLGVYLVSSHFICNLAKKEILKHLGTDLIPHFDFYFYFFSSRCICAIREFHNVEKNYFDFPCSLLFYCLIWHIFLV